MPGALLVPFHSEKIAHFAPIVYFRITPGICHISRVSSTLPPSLLYAFGWRANCILPRTVIHTNASAITVDMTGVMPSRIHVDTPVKQAHNFAHKLPC